MSSPPKRPSPPLPDPNWELELHGPAGGARSPDSRDELLAHAVLREPKPLDLDDDDFADLGRIEPERPDVERVTAPPPAGMDDHVARMMAEAEMLEAVNEGDRPTPLFDLEPVPSATAKPALRPPAPAEPAPFSPPRGAAGRGAALRPAAGAAPKPEGRSPPREPSQAQRGAMPARPGAGRPMEPEPFTPEPLRAETPPPFGATRPAEPAKKMTPAPFAVARPAPRVPTPAPMRAVGPALPVKKMTPAPFAAARPALRAPTPAPMRAVGPAAPAKKMTPAPFAVGLRDVPVIKTPATPEEGQRRISSLDLEDLPAVFSLDGLSLDEPASEPSAHRQPQSEPAISPSLALPPSSEPVISPSLVLPPSSEPAISPPFGSVDPVELAAELSEIEGAWGEPEPAHAPAAPSPPPQPAGPAPETMAAIAARLNAGDFGRALVLAEAALDAHPGNADLARSAETCRDELYKRYLERLGAADNVPRLAMKHGAITGLALDHRAGFLLSCVDGGSTVEEIIDVSAMPRLEAVRVLYELLQEGVIEMTARR